MAEVLSVKSATVASVVERNQEKSRYAFEINVNWSNGGTSTCIKSYQEFFTVHCQLLDEFPNDAGKTGKSPRIIPFLPGKKIFRRSTKRLAQERLPLLDAYVQALVSLPDHISCSSTVREFLEYETILKFVPEGTDSRGLEEVKITDHVVSYTSPTDAANPSHSHLDHGTSATTDLRSTTINAESHSVNQEGCHGTGGDHEETKQVNEDYNKGKGIGSDKDTTSNDHTNDSHNSVIAVNDQDTAGSNEGIDTSAVNDNTSSNDDNTTSSSNDDDQDNDRSIDRDDKGDCDEVHEISERGTNDADTDEHGGQSEQQVTNNNETESMEDSNDLQKRNL